MQFIKDLIAVNCLTQGALLILFFSYRPVFDGLFVIYQNSEFHFWFLACGMVAFFWIIWTVISYITGIRRLGYKAENAARKSRR